MNDICEYCKTPVYPDDESVSTSMNIYHVECAAELGFEDDEG